MSKDNKSWKEFTSGLARLAKAEGNRVFLTRAFEFLNEYVAVDSCAVFKISLDKVSGAEHLCTFGELDDDLAELLAENYVNTGYLQDPIIQSALPKGDKVKYISEHLYSKTYRTSFFEKAGLIDKVTSLHSTRTALFSANFYRASHNGMFSDPDLVNLQKLAPVISQYILRHVRVTTENQLLQGLGLERRISDIVEDSTQVFVRLSVRERQVCKLLLLGTEERLIAKELGVSQNTIVTYRQRLYAKLGIASKEELFQVALLSI